MALLCHEGGFVDPGGDLGTGPTSPWFGRIVLPTSGLDSPRQAGPYCGDTVGVVRLNWELNPSPLSKHPPEWRVGNRVGVLSNIFDLRLLGN